MVKIKVIHIFDIAGVSSIIAHTMDKKFGTESIVITNRDPWGVTTYGRVLNKHPIVFWFIVLYETRKYDIIHLNFHTQFAWLFKLFYPKKPLIIHYHGSEIRKKWDTKRDWRHANYVYVSTKDLLIGAPEHVEYLPNPVDTSLFYPRDLSQIPQDSACYFSYDADDVALKLAREHDLCLTIYERNQPHRIIPEILSKHKLFLDIKRVNGVLLYPKGIYSKLALEALRIGLKVISTNGEITSTFPIEHDTELITQKVYATYKKLLQEI